MLAIWWSLVWMMLLLLWKADAEEEDSSSPLCPGPEWELRATSQKCFRVEETPTNWFDCETVCAPGRRACVTDESEYAWLDARYGFDFSYWLAFNDLDEEGAFRWPDYCAVIDDDYYSPWAEGEPNDVNGGEDCAVSVGGRWNDAPCDFDGHECLCEFAVSVNGTLHGNDGFAIVEVFAGYECGLFATGDDSKDEHDKDDDTECLSYAEVMAEFDISVLFDEVQAWEMCVEACVVRNEETGSDVRGVVVHNVSFDMWGDRPDGGPGGPTDDSVSPPEEPWFGACCCVTSACACAEPSDASTRTVVEVGPKPWVTCDDADEDYVTLARGQHQLWCDDAPPAVIEVPEPSLDACVAACTSSHAVDAAILRLETGHDYYECHCFETCPCLASASPDLGAVAVAVRRDLSVERCEGWHRLYGEYDDDYVDRDDDYVDDDWLRLLFDVMDEQYQFVSYGAECSAEIDGACTDHVLEPFFGPWDDDDLDGLVARADCLDHCLGVVEDTIPAVFVADPATGRCCCYATLEACGCARRGVVDDESLDDFLHHDDGLASRSLRTALVARATIEPCDDDDDDDDERRRFRGGPLPPAAAIALLGLGLSAVAVVLALFRDLDARAASAVLQKQHPGLPADDASDGAADCAPGARAPQATEGAEADDEPPASRPPTSSRRELARASAPSRRRGRRRPAETDAYKFDVPENLLVQLRSSASSSSRGGRGRRSRHGGDATSTESYVCECKADPDEDAPRPSPSVDAEAASTEDDCECKADADEDLNVDPSRSVVRRDSEERL